VATAFQPDISEKVVQRLKPGVRGQLDVHPILGAIAAFDEQMKDIFFPRAPAA
jgi:hypothetical protein